MRPSATLLKYATAGLLVSALPLVFGGSIAALVALLMGFGLLVVGFDALLLRLAMPRIIQLDFPPRGSVGQALDGQLVLEAPQSWMDVTLRLETHGALDSTQDIHVARPCGRRSTHSVTVRASRRGQGSIDAVWIRARGPWKLLERIVRVKFDVEVRITPDLALVRRLALPARGAGSLQGNNVSAMTGSGTEFDELQIYRAGMDSRAIDWKASARHRDLRVRRYRLEQNQNLVVMLDNANLGADDRAVHTGLALAQVALREGDRVALHVFGAQPRAWVPFGNGTRHLHRFVHALCDLGEQEHHSNPVSGARHLLARLRRRSMIVLITDLRDPVQTELLTEATTMLRRSHEVLLVTLRDTDEDAIREPETFEDVAQTLLVRNLAAERRRAIERIRSQGVQVLSTRTSGAARTLMRRYVGQKRRVG